MSGDLRNFAELLVQPNASWFYSCLVKMWIFPLIHCKHQWDPLGSQWLRSIEATVTQLPEGTVCDAAAAEMLLGTSAAPRGSLPLQRILRCSRYGTKNNALIPHGFLWEKNRSLQRVEWMFPPLPCSQDQIETEWLLWKIFQRNQILPRFLVEMQRTGRVAKGWDNPSICFCLLAEKLDGALCESLSKTSFVQWCFLVRDVLMMVLMQLTSGCWKGLKCFITLVSDKGMSKWKVIWERNFPQPLYLA